MDLLEQMLAWVEGTLDRGDIDGCVDWEKGNQNFVVI